MASIANDPGGRKRIQFTGLDGLRKTIRLGKVSMKTAGEVSRRIELILEGRMAGVSLDRETTQWIASLPAELHDKLVKAGLVEVKEETKAPTLGAVIIEFMRSLNDLEERSLAILNNSMIRIGKLVGAEKRVDTITPADCDTFVFSLKNLGYSKASMANFIKHFKRLMMFAHDRKYVVESPARKLRGFKQKNKEKQVFVSRETIITLLGSLEGTEWPLLVVMARFAGIRVPSEIKGMRWDDFQPTKNRFVIHSPKTKRYEGQDKREAPIFPELVPFLAEQRKADPTGEYVFPTLRLQTGLPHSLVRRIKKAGLLPWVKPWVNLRSTCSTELCDTYPSHVVSAWLGHSERIADEHYRQVTDDHFKAASDGKIPVPETAEKPVSETASEGPA